MGRNRQWVAMATVLALGYLAGSTHVLRLPQLFAQNQPTVSEDTQKKVQAAYDALRSAMDSLKQEGLYKPVTKGLNSYAVLAGGLDAEADLEEGRGVDPETFAALYAGDATETVAEQLSRDDQGRLTYKNKVIRIYPISRLKQINSQRQILTGEVSPASNKNP